MSRFVGFLKRISAPLKAIEYIVAFLVIGSAILAVVEAVTDDPLTIGTATSFRLLVDQYNVLAYLLVVMAAVALADIISLIALPEKHEKYRAIATFAFSVGFFFLGVLSFLTIGANHLLWVNDMALAAISATLYISIKAGTVYEYID